MNIMNLIHDICLTKNSINSTPNWRFISKNKYKKKLNNDISEFLNLDIFSASENVISFLICFDEEIIDETVSGFLQSSATFIRLELPDNNEIDTKILYLAKANCFEISNKDVAYTIFRNNRVSNRINKMWEPLTDKIKERYVEIIIQMADYLVLKQQEVK